jgi:hypothetical protein
MSGTSARIQNPRAERLPGFVIIIPIFRLHGGSLKRVNFEADKSINRGKNGEK